ncbi:hypothetical protein H5410_056061 [Solanum commersonii]|uniref:Uncharacterized protein n=1 Tax=Solanum commersonii TaxID=4109 RepID=A0A9J5WL03_SOLCO|nr:hypothetical protein H5410_056061 [Solanum commersonii]
MIEPDGSSWHLAKDATRALKDCVRRLYTHAYHSWSEIPNIICQVMFNEFKYVVENLDSSVQMTPELSTQIWTEKVVGGHTRVESMVEALETITTYIGTGRVRAERVAEQQSMSATVQQIKKQVLNLARQPTTSALEVTDDDSDEDDDFVDRTP